MDQGYCILQIMFDGSGEPTDASFLDVNPAFEKHTGIANAAGKPLRQLVPGIESKWLEIFSRVAATGEASRFEEESKALGRWFDLYVFRVGAPDERKVAVLITDVTERKRQEQNMQLMSGINDELSG